MCNSLGSYYVLNPRSCKTNQKVKTVLNTMRTKCRNKIKPCWIYLRAGHFDQTQSIYVRSSFS